MEPALQAGDRVLVVRAPLRVGDVVALNHGARVLVKRIAAIDRDEVLVHGDNAAASTDSRAFGPVPRSSILGRAIYRYAPRERAGRVGRVPLRG